MEERPLKTKLSIALDPEVVEKIKRMAIDDDRSFSSYINRILRDYIKHVENNRDDRDLK